MPLGVLKVEHSWHGCQLIRRECEGDQACLVFRRGNDLCESVLAPLQSSERYQLLFNSIDELQGALARHNYVAERGLSTAIYLALKLKRPLFLEGEAGVGKTEIAKVLAVALDTELIRLQCYEGLDAGHAVYEWNFARQMLHLRAAESRNEKTGERDLFDERFLLKRPLLQAIDPARSKAPVLLIDELDRSDDEFEAYLLEVLSEFQVTIPELGTIKASHAPVVVITSNRTREVHDALKRRCLYYWIEYPAFDKELEIVRAKVPGCAPALAAQVTRFVQELRREDLFKLPGVAETLDWVTALVALDQRALSPGIVDDTLGVVLKYQDDVQKIKGAQAGVILDRVGAMTR
jgi:MoxR-like ATPase